MKCITQNDINKLRLNNELPDEQNPIYIFNLASNELIAAIARGDIDPVLLAKNACANRGINDKGEWIGFDNAKLFFKIN